MTPQELKNSILQLAIQGKLVEQRPEEGTAQKLYREIQAEKQRITKAGKIKREKPLPEIAEEEKPFEIPESWMWVRLGDLLRVIGGITYKNGDVSKKGLRILRGGNIQDGKIILDEADVFLPLSYDDLEKRVQKCDIVIVASTGSKAVIGKAGYVDREIPDAMIGAFLRICRTYTKGIESYLRYIFEGPYYRKHIRDLSQGTNINNVKESYITEFSIPFPPLAEQKRIVAKIEELLPYIDRYEQAWSRLETFNQRFPDDMRKSILQLAIRGKLVEQRPEEGTAEELYREIQVEKQRLIKAGKIKKEKPLPEIAEEEKPFEIPGSWKWVRLTHLARVTGGFAFKSTNYTDNGTRVIRISDFNESGFVNNKIVRHPYDDSLLPYVLEEKNILLCMTGGTVGKSFFVKELKEKMVVNQRVATIKIDSAIPEYVNYVIISPITQEVIQHSKNSTNDNISMDTIQNFLIPLPPLAEQKRIVARLEELLPLCEKLK